MPFHVIIPARHASTRFPGKPLADLHGKPMVVRVCERAAGSGALSVHVATDDARIAQAVTDCGFDSVMTQADHASGTDRLAEAVTRLGFADDAVVVNVQGDEPLIEPSLILEVASVLQRDADAPMSTACHPIRDAEAIRNPNIVKVVLDARNRALYFSRAPIPYARDAYAGGIRDVPQGLPCYRHAGIYGYRAGFLSRYAALAPSPLERFEALEQLRVLWHGHAIAVAIAGLDSAPGVDTPEDLEKVRALFDRDGNSG